MAKIFLNEGTEIEVSETKAEIRNKIKEDVRKEKNKEEDVDHFIEVTIINTTVSSVGFSFGKSIPVPEEERLKADLYYKRILFIYD